METHMDRPRRRAIPVDSSAASTRTVGFAAVEQCLDAQFLVEAGQGWEERGRLRDEPYRVRRRPLSSTRSSIGVANPQGLSVEPPDATAYLVRLAAELEFREWLCVEGDGPVLQVVHPFVHCLAGSVGCCRDSAGGCDFAWTDGDLIGPVDEVNAAADRVENGLRVGGAAGGAW
jgi:hypothetical protein